MIGRTIAQYRVLKRLGSGGMGEVYLAEDLRLGRRVALKVLLPEQAGRATFLERFRREARAAAALQHPNIVTIHSVEEAEGIQFLTLELVEGSTLADLIPSEGMPPMPLDRMLRIAVQLADALCAAHERGIIHRDIKPRNLMIDADGRLKVLDFGIAKRLFAEDEPTLVAGQPQDAEELTREGQILGTVSYMSPEQLQGLPLDPRSDLFSVGVVLYQMATGHLPFRGRNPAEQMMAMLEQPASLPGVVRAGLPRRFDEIVARCLERDLRQRYQSARVLHGDLEALQREPVSSSRLATVPEPPPARTRSFGRWTGGAAVAVLLLLVTGMASLVPRRPASLAMPKDGTHALAVLPLENLSGEQEYFVDGMTDSLIASLGNIGKVRVISRQSVMRFKGSEEDLPSIARQLGVDLVLTGSVLRAGERVRITTELVQANPEEQLWSESYQRNLRDILALQGEVAQEVARQVRLELTDQEASRLSAARTVDPVAYDFYLQGRYHWEKRTREELEKAIGYFEKAIARDPGYAAAHAGLADAHAQLGYFRHESPETAFPKARAEVNRALALDPDLAEAHASLGYLKLIHDWDGAGSEAALRRALALNPSYAPGHHWLALNLSSVGRLEEAGEHFRTARQLNPFSSTLNTIIGTHLLVTGDVNGSIEQCRKAIDLEPKFTFAYDNLWIALDVAGRLDEAFAAYEKVLSLRGHSDLARSARRIYATSGYRAALARTGDELAAAGPAQLNTLIQSYVLAGENAKALTWLERALERRDPLVLWLRYTAHLRRLQGEPRFRKLLAQVDRLRSRAG